jgi:hypothetical protein
MIDIDPNIVELAAQAIRDVVCSRGRINPKAKDWDDLPERQRQYYREEARAALMAVAFSEPPIMMPADVEFAPDLRPGCLVYRK